MRKDIIYTKQTHRIGVTLISILLLMVSCSGGPEIENGRKDHIITSKNRVRLHIREIIPKKQSRETPLVMVHGGGPGATASFDLPVKGGSFAQAFVNKGHKVYLVNIRGWENSTLPDYNFSDSTTVVGSYLEASEDILAAITWIRDREKTKKVNLFGWATGGHWASYYSIQYPETVKTLISLNALYGVNAHWELRKFFASEEDSTRFNKTSFFRESAQENLTRSWSRTIPIAQKEQWRDSIIEKAYRTYASRFGEDTTVLKVPGGYREESFYMSLGKKYWHAKNLKVPTLAIRTELDFWSRPEDLEQIQRDLENTPQSKCITIPGTHYVFLDRPERGRQRLIEEILKFTEMKL